MPDPLTKRGAARLLAFVESELVSFRHIHPWAHEVISSQESPPPWVIDVAVLKYQPDVAKCIREYVYSEPFEQIESTSDEYLACLLLRHESGELSWASFLREAGDYADASDDCSWDCSLFFRMLNDFEGAEFADKCAARQRQAVLVQYGGVVDAIRPDYQRLVQCRRAAQHPDAADPTR
jgi:hypothetical protein